MKICTFACLFPLFAALTASTPLALAQDSRSATLARELVATLDAAKLDSIAAKDPTATDRFFAVLYIPNIQLLVVDGQYSSPLALETRIYRREYRDAYLDLNGASVAATRLLIVDMGANGLTARREPDQPFDSVEASGKRTMFDSNWKAQKIREEDYLKTFADADARYAHILTALIAQAKNAK